MDGARTRGPLSGTPVSGARAGPEAVVVAEETSYLGQDSFTDSNGTALTSHEPEEGPPWVAITGTVEIQNNAAQATVGEVVQTQDGSEADVTIEVDVWIAENYDRVGIAARVDDADNYWEVVAFAKSNKIQINKYENGSRSVEANGAVTVNTSTWYTLRLEISGNTMTAWLDGEAETSVTDPFNNAQTKHGLLALSGVDGKWDNWEMVAT